MSQVTFNIKLLVDGKEKIVEAKTDVSKLADEFEKAKSGATKFRDKLLEFNQTAQSFQNLASGLQQLSGAFGQFTQAYADQEAAETRLANNMRNTMDAREEDIQSIKDLCAAQQQLGVIGDEVQLAGAQELATYLTMKDGLQTLIPVMNDMLAQQYGLNATQEQAQTIASMLGKVMDGQVGALSRYGYKFDEAQEQVLKFGTEQQRVAVLAEVVSSAVGGSNEALRQTPSGQVKAVADIFGDLKEQVGAATVHLQPFVNGLAQIGMAASGFTNLASGAAGALRAIKDLTTGTRALAAAQGAARTITLGFAATTRVLTAAMRGATIGATTLKVAIRGLMAATGVGLAIAALTWVLEKLFSSSEKAADGMDDVSEASQRLQQQVDAEKSAYSDARVEMDKEIAKLGELMKAKGDTTTAVNDLNSKYGEAFGYHKTAAEWYKTLTENSETYCRQLGLEAKMKVLAAQGADIDFDLEKNRREQERLRKEGKDTESGSTAVMTNQFGIQVGGGVSYTRDTKEMAALKEEEAKLNKAKEANQKDFNIAKDMTADLSKKIKTTPTGIKTTPTGGKDPKGGNGNNNVEVTFEKGSLGYIDQELEKLRKKRLAVTVDADRLKLDEQIADLEREKLELEFRPKMEGWKQVDEELAKRGIGMDAKPAVVEVEFAPKFDPAKVVAEIKGKIPVLKIPAAMSPEEKRGEYDRLSQKASTIQQDYEIGIIGKDEALAAIASINAELERLGLEPIDMEVKSKGFEEAMGAISGLANSMGSLAEGSKEMAVAMSAASLGATLATMIAGMVKKNNESTLTIWDWIAGIAAGTAAVLSAASQLKGVGAFAQGGIVSGPTMALVGEYAGASNNPEVIAPLDKLRSMLHPQGGVGGTVRFEIEGRKLVGVIGNEKKLSRTKL